MKGEESKSLKIQEADKMNILCLHGYRQNSVSFKNKTGSLRKLLKNYANFTYVEAPHLAKAMEGEEQSEEQKSWWYNKDDGSFKGTNQCGPAFGFEESIKHVEKTWNEHGNFQGIMGFSQGACFVSLICSMSERSRKYFKNQQLRLVLIKLYHFSNIYKTSICYYVKWISQWKLSTQKLIRESNQNAFTPHLWFN